MTTAYRIRDFDTVFVKRDAIRSTSARLRWVSTPVDLGSRGRLQILDTHGPTQGRVILSIWADLVGLAAESRGLLGYLVARTGRPMTLDVLAFHLDVEPEILSSAMDALTGVGWLEVVDAPTLDELDAEGNEPERKIVRRTVRKNVRTNNRKNVRPKNTTDGDSDSDRDKDRDRDEDGSGSLRSPSPAHAPDPQPAPANQARYGHPVIDEWAEAITEHDPSATVGEPLTPAPAVLNAAEDFQIQFPEREHRRRIMAKALGTSRFHKGGIAFRKFLTWAPGLATEVAKPPPDPNDDTNSEPNRYDRIRASGAWLEEQMNGNADGAIGDMGGGKAPGILHDASARLGKP